MAEFYHKASPTTFHVLKQFCIFQNLHLNNFQEYGCTFLSNKNAFVFDYCICQVNICLKFNIHIPDALLAETAGLNRHCKYIYITVAFYTQIPILFQSFQPLSPTFWSSEYSPNLLNSKSSDHSASSVQKKSWNPCCLIWCAHYFIWLCTTFELLIPWDAGFINNEKEAVASVLKWLMTNYLCVLFILNLDTEWCKLSSGRSGPRRRRRRWAGQGWCRSSCASGSLSRSGCYTQTTLSRWTSLHSLQSRRKRAWWHKQLSLGSPRELLALCHEASNSGHKTWHEKQHWTGTNTRLQHAKCTPEVIVQAEEMLMVNGKHPLMTIRVGRWPASSWKPTWPSLKCLVECVWPKSLQVQRALAARSLCSESCTVFQREITCTLTHAQIHPSPKHAERPPCFD